MLTKWLILSFLFFIFPLHCGQFAPKPLVERSAAIDWSKQQVLFRDQQVLFQIVIPEDAAPAAHFAARELAEHLGNVLKIQLTPRSEKVPDLPALIVGDAGLAAAHGIDLQKLGRDAFIIKTIGSDILIVGHDEQVPFSCSSPTEQGTLFAVYEFLERFAGVRFYFPGEIGTVTPHLTQWTIPEIDLLERPDMQVRWLYSVDPFSGKNQISWFDEGAQDYHLAYRRYHLANRRYRMHTKHIPNCHGLAWLALVERFGKNHPEYFALTKEGKRKNGIEDTSNYADKEGHICFSSEALKNEIFLDAKAVLTGQPASSRRAIFHDGKPAWPSSYHTPGEFFNIMPNDNLYLCRCPECKKHLDDNVRPGQSEWSQQTSNYIWKFYIDVAARLKKENIPGFVTTMAYGQYSKVPELDIPDNIVMMLALSGPWDRYRYSGKRQKDQKLLEAWTEKLNAKCYLWTYPTKIAVPVRGIPNMTPKAFASYFAEKSPFIFGAFIEAENDYWIFGYLNYYVFGKVMWNVKTDIEALLLEHHSLMFAEAAPEMQDFYETIETHWLRRIVGKTVDTPAGPVRTVPTNYEIWNQIYSPAERKRINTLFQKAENKVENNPLALKRVKFIHEKLWSPLLLAAEEYEKTLGEVTDWTAEMPELPPENSIIIDGKGDEKAWEKSKPFWLLTNKGNPQEEVDVQTICRALHDADNFYFFIECMEPFTNEINARTRQMDDAMLWRDDDLELFFNPSGDRETGYQILVNSKNSLADCRFTRNLSEWEWDSNAEVKTIVTNGEKWSMEIRIPRKSMPDCTGRLICNILRSRRIGDKRDPWYSWSPYVETSRQLENFGALEFQPAESFSLLTDSDLAKPVDQHGRIGAWRGTAPLRQDRRIFRTGGASVRLEEDAEVLVQTINGLKPSTRYRLSFFIKTSNVKSLSPYGGGIYVRFEQAQKGKTIIFPPDGRYQGDIPWTKQIFELTTAEQIGKNPYIQFSRHNKLTTGTAWIDQVELLEINEK